MEPWIKAASAETESTGKCAHSQDLCPASNHGNRHGATRFLDHSKNTKRAGGFHRAVHAVQFVCSIIKMYKDYAASQAEKMSFAELSANSMATRSPDLLFDVSEFRAKRERIVGQEAQWILCKPPADRSAEEIKLATLALRSAVDAFAEFPQTMQQQLAAVGWYESFGPGRVIIRQGHIPQNFYLILGGQALVSKASVDELTGAVNHKTAAFLKAGHSFGDVAILKNARRNATVVCDNTVCLLAVSRQDFKNLFVRVTSGNDGPEFLHFLRHIRCFEGWSLDLLPFNNTGVCMHAFFRRNTVISKDTGSSPFVYIIKSGTVEVLKKLSAVKPCRLTHRKKSAVGQISQAVPGCKSNQHTHPKEGWVSSENVMTPESPPTLRCDPRPQSYIYIRLQNLREGEVFGLEYLVFEDTCSMTLVSEGAECILIAKDFIRKHAPAACLNTLRAELQPYPSHSALQQQLQEHCNWQAYKHTLLRRSLHRR